MSPEPQEDPGTAPRSTRTGRPRTPAACRRRPRGRASARSPSRRSPVSAPSGSAPVFFARRPRRSPLPRRTAQLDRPSATSTWPLRRVACGPSAWPRAPPDNAEPTRPLPSWLPGHGLGDPRHPGLAGESPISSRHAGTRHDPSFLTHPHVAGGRLSPRPRGPDVRTRPPGFPGRSVLHNTVARSPPPRLKSQPLEGFRGGDFSRGEGTNNSI